jgi:hypothetical protein
VFVYERVVNVFTFGCHGSGSAVALLGEAIFVAREIIMNAKLAIVAVCGLAAGVANAQVGRVVNISGATLLENYVRSVASTNDYIDVDGDGQAGIFGSASPDQLAPGGPTGAAGQYWVIQYRVVGSVNGFIELTRFGSPNYVTTDSFDVNGILGASVSPNPNPGVATFAYNNRTLYITNGNQTGAYNAGNPGGAPNRSTSLLNPLGTYSAPPTGSAGGIAIDIAPLDVAATWAVRKAGPAAWDADPFDAGYGTNAKLSVNKIGTTAGAGLSNGLPGLNGRNLFNPLNPGAADSNTIFDTELAFAPIAPVINFGTGLRQITITQLQHHFGTGRGINGENLMVVTRDIGSGTRNAFQNCIGQDPSFGVGDNIGALSTTNAQNNLGAQFQPTNKGSNGSVESTLRNARLAIGYVGTERGVTGSGSGSWLSTGALEIAEVKNDIYGGTAFVRPTTFNILNNNANGWVIGGEAVLSSIGDPRAEPTTLGGDGLTTPRMVNTAAAAYLNNIRKSIAAFVAVPNAPTNDFMPGEFAATQFLLLAALDNLHPGTDASSLVPNPNFNAALKSYTLSNNVHNNAAFASFNTTSAGRVPTRTTGTTYSDGVVNGTDYINQAGASVAYGSVLTLRNKIAGDFSGNGLRDSGDVIEMLKAFRQRNGGPAWTAPIGTGSIAGAPGSDASIEVLGDFQGDGNFNSADVRYFADGLFLVAGNLDRRAGFTQVDTDWNTLTGSSNFFATTLPATVSGPRVYKAGDSRADIAGAVGTTPGFAPVGNDGIVDGKDISYIMAQYRNGDVTWSNLGQAVNADLSADMTGDLNINRDDVTDILNNVLCTRWWDVNLDGVVDSTDQSIATSNLGNAGGWSQGDVDGDGIVTAADVAVICGADFNGDASVDFFDYLDFVAAFSANTCIADFNGDAAIDFFDYLDFVAAFSGGC